MQVTIIFVRDFAILKYFYCTDFRSHRDKHRQINTCDRFLIVVILNEGPGILPS